MLSVADHTLMKESKEVLFTPFIENISLFLSLGMVDEARPNKHLREVCR